MAARKTKPKSPDSQAQPDPKAPLDSAALLKSATPVLKLLAADLLARADNSLSITTALKLRHGKEKSEERTADNYDIWRRDFVEQVAAAWFLSCVFVRTLEDRGLIDRNRLAGPGAEDSQRAFFALVPSLNERDYLLTVFRELQQLPAARELFDARHNPVWLLGPSAEAAKELLGLFRNPQADAPMFRFGNADSRFLGDLYQDISENVRKRYALLQTPRFVERFILDRTLDPAIERFGLNDTNLIDPTCGSGHFLLGAFDRLFDRRLQAEPGLDIRQAASKALEAVAGSDVNPYAVAIAKFRLTLSFIEKAGYALLKDAPKLPLHVVVADSLLHNPQVVQRSFGDMLGQSVEAWKGSEFKLEDEEGARVVLSKQYAAVVGNPPYITVKDAALRERYRKMYPDSAAGKYSLAAPFCERFFQLGKNRGYVGMITANSFMKREFGKTLIEKYLPRVNLETAINTGGAYIPGHGTPTVLMFGTTEKPQRETVLTVLGSRGEPSMPDDPEKGLVWSSIALHWDAVGFENEYITVNRTERASLAKHPWSLGGGGATELKELLEERAGERLGDVTTTMGSMTVTGEDELFVGDRASLRRRGFPTEQIRTYREGEDVRDWGFTSKAAHYPYDDDGRFTEHPGAVLVLWPYRQYLRSSPLRIARNRRWNEYGVVYLDKLRARKLIAWGSIATHNHFGVCDGAELFKQSAPVMRLSDSATDDDHFALLAYLNSSTACFWIKQVMTLKGFNHASDANSNPYLAAYEIAPTQLSQLPLPVLNAEVRGILAAFGRKLNALAAERQDAIFSEIPVDDVGATASELENARRVLLEKQVALGEEVDWYVYGLFGLAPPLEPNFDPAPRILGTRPFENLLAHESDKISGDWFVWHGSKPCPEPVGPIEASRIDLIHGSPLLQWLERPEFKRRWVQSAGKAAQETQTDTKTVRDSLHYQILRRLDEVGAQSTGTFRLSRVVQNASSNPAITDAIGWLVSASPVSLFAFVVNHIQNEAVPFLAACRYTDAGLEKYAAWERTWELQRREDAGELISDIPVPPKYGQEDFRDANYWRLRGKLDVPKERFISFPGCESDEDYEPVYGWAGWDYLQRAQALAQLYNDRRAEGWRADRKDEKPNAAADDQADDSDEKPDKKPFDDRLVPMLAGLLELLPWLLQWHNEPSEELGGQRPGEQFALFLEGQCAEWGLTHEDLRTWRPKAKRARAASSKKSES